MKNWHKEKFIIDDTCLDFKSQVTITEMMKMLQITTFNHSNKIDLDHKTMEEKSNAFWVVTKMKLKINGDLTTGDVANVTTWTHELGTIRAMRDLTIKVKNSVKVKATAEWCCLDYDTRKVRRLSSIVYPNLEMEKKDDLGLVFTNMRENVDNSNFVYQRIVRSSDIDINKHTNNLKYHAMALDALSVNELKEIKINEYEMYFVNETREGEAINIYKKRVKGYYYIEGKTEDKSIFKAVIKFKKKKES